MLIMPLLFVFIVMAFINTHSLSKMGKVSMSVIEIFLGMTAIVALIGIGVSLSFNLDTSSLNIWEAETLRFDRLEANLDDLDHQTITERILYGIPSNPFLDFTGSRSTSAVAIVLFSPLTGIALLKLKKDAPTAAQRLEDLMESLQTLVLKLLKMIIQLTPYGVMTLMTK